MSIPVQPKQQAKRRLDRLVYESRAKKALKRSHPTVPGPGGKQHLYLNAAFPRDHRTGEIVGPLQSAVCAEPKRCGHAYSHLMLNGKNVCIECSIDDAEELVKYLEEQTGESMGFVSPARIVDHARKGVRVMWQPTKLGFRGKIRNRSEDL